MGEQQSVSSDFSPGISPETRLFLQTALESDAIIHLLQDSDRVEQRLRVHEHRRVRNYFQRSWTNSQEPLLKALHALQLYAGEQDLSSKSLDIQQVLGYRSHQAVKPIILAILGEIWRYCPEGFQSEHPFEEVVKLKPQYGYASALGRERIIKANTNRSPSRTARDKMKAAKLGKPSPNKGRHLATEHGVRRLVR